MNINTANSAELQTLQGIGPVIAQRIIDYRLLNGPFQTIEGIKNVSGIGDVIFSNIQSLITVGSVAPPSSGGEDTNTAQTSSTSTQSSSTGSSSSSSGSANIPTISAGTNRVGMVGAPMEFRVERGSSSGGQNIFKWNFGDGTQGGGSVTTHVYEYPGDYTVVLSANFQQGEATARVNVRIIEPEVSLSVANAERVELFNPSSQEINLFGRAISAAGRVFMFPKDTIVRPGARVSFSSKITGLTPVHAGEVEWVVIGENRNVWKVEQMVEARKEEKIASIKNEIDTLQQRLATAQANVVAFPPTQTIVQAEPGALELSEANLAAAMASTEADNRAGWWNRFTKFLLGRR